jgi:hypothetical protein
VALLTDSKAVGAAVPIPILPADWVMTELPWLWAPVQTGIFPAVPLPELTCPKPIWVNRLNEAAITKVLINSNDLENEFMLDA